MKPGQPLECALHEHAMMRADLVQADLPEEFDGGLPGNWTGDIGAARLEFVRPRRVLRGEELHALRHVSAELIRRHGVKQLAPRPQGTYAHWPGHLVTGQGEEITTEGLDVDGNMGSRL